MQTVNTVNALRAQIKTWRAEGLSIGFAPTMGNLHEGHLKLIESAQQRCDKVVSSIFVNPLQFGPNEDFDAYPRTLADDQNKLQAQGCDLLFAPPAEVMYPRGQEPVTQVVVPKLTAQHCGASRPGHFDGVTTVVCKLFNLVQPNVAFFGKKDYQQWRVIQRMTEDLCLPLDIVGVDIVREPSGLALSSRNQYLSQQEKQTAALLNQNLLAAKKRLQAGDKVEPVAEWLGQQLTNAGFKPDYCTVADQHSLEAVSGVWTNEQAWVILVAARLGKARLLDNVEL